MTNNMITKVVRWFEGLFGCQPRFSASICDELPVICEKNKLYLVGERDTYWIAALICPCGCGELIQLALDSTGRPRWKVSMDDNNQFTLTPSLHRKIRCRSHFILRNGKIVWCS